MNTSRIIKTMMFLGGVTTGTLMQATPAFAASSLGWDPSGMATDIGANNGQVTSSPLKQSDVNGFVTTLTSWLAGIAIVIFVLRVVLTAIDRMIFTDGTVGGGGGGRDGGGGKGLPFTYSGEWKDIWIRFAKQMAVVLAAWIIVNLIMQALLWIFGSVGTISTN